MKIRQLAKKSVQFASNFETRRNNLAKLVHAMWCEAGMKIWVHIFGGRTSKNLWGQRSAKFGTISDNYRLWSRISLVEWIKQSTIGKRRYQLQSFPRWEKKKNIWWT